MARFQNILEIEPSLEGRNLRVGIVMARFNAQIGDGLLSGCVEQLLAHGVGRQNIVIATVPGALELPLTLKTMAASGRFEALIALGAVIRGETYHFEIVANEMASGITRVQLDMNIPIANGVLTTEDDEQALERMVVKGGECACAAIEMANLLKSIR